MSSLVIKQIITMAIIVIAGFIFAKAFKLGDKEQKFLSKMLLYFVNPCLVLNSFNLEFDPLKLKQFLFVFAVALLIHGVMILIATVTTLKKTDISTVDRVATVFTNCGFMGIPLIRGVFGDEGIFFLMGYLIVFNLVLWTWGCYQLGGVINLKKIITNPNIIAVILGLILFCMPFTLPVVISKPLSMIGDMNTAMAMILIGVMFANFKLEKSMLLQLAKCQAIRLLLCSVINLCIVFGIYKLVGPAGLNMPNAKMMLCVAFFCSMCPSATSVPSLSCIFDKDTSYASLVVSVSHLLCMLTIPAFAALADLMMQ